MHSKDTILYSDDPDDYIFDKPDDFADLDKIIFKCDKEQRSITFFETTEYRRVNVERRQE